MQDSFYCGCLEVKIYEQHVKSYFLYRHYQNNVPAVPGSSGLSLRESEKGEGQLISSVQNRDGSNIYYTFLCIIHFYVFLKDFYEFKNRASATTQGQRQQNKLNVFHLYTFIGGGVMDYFPKLQFW